jgi:hypothetical protein
MSDWDHITIPVTQGEVPNTEDVGRRSVEEVMNLVSVRDGGLRTRPAFTEDTHRYFVATENGVPTAGTIYDGLDQLPLTLRAVTKVRAGGGETPLVLHDGRAFVQSPAADWQDLGSFWSARITDLGFTGRDLEMATAGAFPRPHGAASSSDGSIILSVYQAVHASDGQLIAGILPSTSPVLHTHRCPVAYGTYPGYVYNTAAGELRCVAVNPADPHTGVVDILVASDARTTAGQYQWGCLVGTTLYIAYLTTLSGQVKIAQVNTLTGAVGAAASFTNANQLGTVSLCFDNGRLVVAYSESAGTLDVKTKVFTTALVDQAIDYTFFSTTAAYSTAVGPGALGSGNVTVCWGTIDPTDASVRVGTRATLSATGATLKTFYGGSSGLSAYFLRYAPWRQSGRVLFGIAHAVSATTAGGVNATWAILDITAPADDNPSVCAMVAQGPALTSAGAWCTPVDHRGTGEPLITSVDYTSFDASGGVYGGLRMMRLDLDGDIPVVEAAGSWYLGGSVTHTYDGQFLADAGFWSVPAVSATAVAGGSVTAGSYAFCTVWAWTDGQGRRHRSAPSAIGTVVTAAANLTIAMVAATIQVSHKTRPEIEFYLSTINPPASGAFPLYLVSTNSNTIGSATITVNVTTTADLTEKEILYATGGVLSNFPPPGSDGGLVTAGQRLWAATGQRLCASKLIDRPGAVPAWSEDLEVVIPSAGGPIRALVAEGNGVLVMCDRAIYVVGGDGYDDLLQGQGFSEPSLVSDLGCTGAGGWVRTPKGIIFQGADLRIHGLGGSGTEHASFAVDSGLLADRVTMLHWPAMQSVLMFPQTTGTRYVLVFNYRIGQWYRWLLENDDANLTPLNGAMVDDVPWTASSADDYVMVGTWALDAGADHFEAGDFAFLQHLYLSWLRLDEERSRGWARLGSVNLLGTAYTAGQLVLNVDRDYVVLTLAEEHTRTLTPVPGSPDSTWPSQRMAPEIRTNRQKASAVRLRFQLTGLVSISEIELDVRRAAPRAPSGNRS